MRPFVGEAVTIGARLAGIFDRVEYVFRLARLRVLDRLRPPEETPVDRAIRARKVSG
jgi:hypothetical protein